MFGAGRVWSRDDPVLDARDAAVDDRPVRFVCEHCGEPIRGEAAGYYGDDYYEFDEIRIHRDCLTDWVKNFLKEA